MKIGILYICTGKYTVFWDGFYVSAEKYLLPDYEKHYFVFTDGEINCYDNPLVHTLYQEKLGWPFDTLYRFHIFLKAEQLLKEMDYLYFFNSNLIFKQIVGKEILPDKKQEVVVTLHPGFYNKKRVKFTYEENKKSTAYISAKEGKYYIAGGLNGGSVDVFLDMAKTLKDNIDADYRNGIVARWHDESHINHYIIDKDIKILSPAYLYPEGKILPFEARILILDKNLFGGHDFLRQCSNQTEISIKSKRSWFNRLFRIK